MKNTMRASKAQTIMRKLATRRPFYCTNTTRDGRLRTWRGQYQGGPIRGTLVTVFDLDKEEVRTLNVETVHTFGLIREKGEAAPPKPQASQDAARAPRQTWGEGATWEKEGRQMARELFG